jgi:hypothetical protein
VATFPFHHEITRKHADEHVKRTALELRSQFQIRLGKFEERFDAPTHAVDANDLDIFQCQVGAEQNKPIPLPIAILDKDQLDRQTTSGLNDDRTQNLSGLFLGKRAYSSRSVRRLSPNRYRCFISLTMPITCSPLAISSRKSGACVNCPSGQNQAIGQFGGAKHDKIDGHEAETIRPPEREHVVTTRIASRRMIKNTSQQFGLLAAIPTKNRIVDDESSNVGIRSKGIKVLNDFQNEGMQKSSPCKVRVV